jgi:hypothetical protein
MAREISIQYGSGERPTPPAEMLWKAVISLAVRDFFDPRRRSSASHYIENSDDFIKVCQLASLDPQMVRRRFSIVAAIKMFRLPTALRGAALSFVMGTMSESEFQNRLRRHHAKGSK